MTGTGKVPWSGVLTSIQPRIRLTRLFDQRSHAYQGYVLRITGTVGDKTRETAVAISGAVQARHGLQVGDTISAEGEPVADPRLETAELYKVSKLRVIARVAGQATEPPPWHGIPTALPVYRERGHRRLAAHTYDTSCVTCIWGTRMAVEMIIDHWNPSQKRYRMETFCYGPLSCRLYKAGPTRKVPGRRGMSWEEEDWVDGESVAHRDPEE